MPVLDLPPEIDVDLLDRQEAGTPRQARHVSAGLKLQDQLAQSLIRGILLAVPALIAAHAMCVSDPDIWWHLRSGEWIMQNHAFPYTDPFSSFGAGKPWAAYSWLFEVGVLQLFQSLGLTGIVVYTSVMMMGISAALYHLIRRLQADFTVAVLLTLVAVISLGRLYTPRPWHFTILFFILLLDILMQARRTGRLRELAWLPLIFALWANLHIQFVDGLIVLVLACAEAIASVWWSAARTRLRLVPIVAVSAACLLATLINPYGWEIYKVAHDLAAQPGVIDHITELQAIPFRGLPDYCVLLLGLAAVAALARRRRMQPFEAALLGMAFVLAFRSQRDVWILVASASTIIAAYRQAAKADPATSPEHQAGSTGAFVWTTVLTSVLAGLLLFAGFRTLHVNNGRLRTLLAADLPVDAVQAIKSSGLKGQLFNDYGWGGYLIWSLRQPVSIDGRAALYGDQRLDCSTSTWNGAPDWHANKELAAAGIVIGPVKAPLTQLLRLDPRFKLAYEDKVAAVFVPSAPAHKDYE